MRGRTSLRGHWEPWLGGRGVSSVVGWLGDAQVAKRDAEQLGSLQSLKVNRDKWGLFSKIEFPAMHSQKALSFKRKQKPYREWTQCLCI